MFLPNSQATASPADRLTGTATPSAPGVTNGCPPDVGSREGEEQRSDHGCMPRVLAVKLDNIAPAAGGSQVTAVDCGDARQNLVRWGFSSVLVAACVRSPIPASARSALSAPSVFVAPPPTGAAYHTCFDLYLIERVCLPSYAVRAVGRAVGPAERLAPAHGAVRNRCFCNRMHLRVMRTPSVCS